LKFSSFLRLFKRSSSARVARERLMMVLTFERRGLPSDFADRIQKDLVSVLTKYPQLSVAGIAVDIRRDGDRDQLYISVPFSEGR